eukprot:1180168-Alexandrium_andersonii.AAC.1
MGVYSTLPPPSAPACPPRAPATPSPGEQRLHPAAAGRRRLRVVGLGDSGWWLRGGHGGL